MAAYIVRRVLFMIPTLFGIMVLNFVIIHVAPGGPVEQLLAELGEADMGAGVDVTARISGTGGGETVTGAGGDLTARYRGARGLDPEFIREIERMYGFDRPPVERFFTMMWNYLRFDFGESYFRDRSVVLLIVDKMDVSISLGLWTTLLVYLVSIPPRHRQGGARRRSPSTSGRAPRSSSATRSPASSSRSCSWCCSRGAASSTGSRSAA